MLGALYQSIASTCANNVARFDDIYMFLWRLLAICLIRFAISGVYQRQFRKIPCLLDYIIPADLSDIRRRKIGENVWYALWHTTSFCIGMSLFWSPSEEKWRNEMFAGRTNYAFLVGWERFQMAPLMKQFYMIELAFWSSCLIYIFIETKRSDFAVMLTHHIFTIGLICLSYYCNHFRMGLVVLFLHDLGDIFLYSAKSMRVFSTDNKVAAWVADKLFVLFAVFFFVCRLVLYPYWILTPVTRTNPLFRDFIDPIMGDKYHINSVLEKWGRETTHGIGYYSFPIMLYGLELLHIFWFTLIIKVATRTMKAEKGVLEAGDIREKTDTDDEEEEEEKRLKEEGKSMRGASNGVTRDTSVRKRVQKYEGAVREKSVDADKDLIRRSRPSS